MYLSLDDLAPPIRAIHLDGARYGAHLQPLLELGFVLSAASGRRLWGSSLSGQRGHGLSEAEVARLRLFTELLGGECEGAQVGSEDFLFVPDQAPRPRTMAFNAHPLDGNQLIVTALLLMSTSREPSTLELSGQDVLGTGSMIRFEYFVLPLLRSLGLKLNVRFEAGSDRNQRTQLSASPGSVRGFQRTTRPPVTSLEVHLDGFGAERKALDQVRTSVRAELSGWELEFRTHHWPSHCPRVKVTVLVRSGSEVIGAFVAPSRGSDKQCRISTLVNDLRAWLSCGSAVPTDCTLTALLAATLASESSELSIVAPPELEACLEFLTEQSGRRLHLGGRCVLVAPWQPQAA